MILLSLIFFNIPSTVNIFIFLNFPNDHKFLLQILKQKTIIPKPMPRTTSSAKVQNA